MTLNIHFKKINVINIMIIHQVYYCGRFCVNKWNRIRYFRIFKCCLSKISFLR